MDIYSQCFKKEKRMLNELLTIREEKITELAG
jgi:hypothetical protein